jgi:hypothetical protein
VAFLGFNGLTFMINGSGNYGFLGILTAVQCFPLLDTYWEYVFPISWITAMKFSLGQVPESVPWWSILGSIIVSTPYLLISLPPLVDTFGGSIPFLEETYDYFKSKPLIGGIAQWVQSKQDLLVDSYFSSKLYTNYLSRFWDRLEYAYAWLSPFSIVNRYAKFGTMTKYRWELVFEGSRDGKHWEEYEFKYKPGKVDKLPPYVPGHLPGLDWRLWFLPSGVRRGGVGTLPSWYFSFIQALLEGRKEVLDLLESSPFPPEDPPKYVRALLYDYRFADQPTPKTAPSSTITRENEGDKGEEEDDREPAGAWNPNTKAWWRRELVGQATGPHTLSKNNEEEMEQKEEIMENLRRRLRAS